MQGGRSYLLGKIPFIKLLIPFAAGIILQWHMQPDLSLWVYIFLATLASLLLLFILPAFEKFRYGFISGIMVFMIFLSLGAGLAWVKDIRHQKNWFGNFYSENVLYRVTLQEPLSEKTKSYKSIASVNAILSGENSIPVNGNIIIYFQKDSLPAGIGYGSQLLIAKPLQPIKNSGNPGGFDYRRYCLFQDISHQLYLKKEDFVLLDHKNESAVKKFLFSTREKVLSILKKNIPGKKEQGLAEALLIGYKDDLDKNLVQAYSNTGVVHVIAISGLHLGLIYWLLVQLLKPLGKRKNLRWLRPVLIIASLWLFSLLAGAQPSVLRSAVMFTCIVIGETMVRRTSIFNTLAFSAFILLCINPYWLWDVGFQLSYAAVLSIVIFMRPVYNWFYVKNKTLDFIWKLNAVTIAAQIFTVPLSMYHFHQFPNFFLLTNFVAVPLSSIILIGEIILCVVSLIPIAASFTGKILSWLIKILNDYIERIDRLPFAIWDGIQISIPQAILMIAAAAGFSYWLMEKNKAGLRVGLLALFSFLALRSFSFFTANQQTKIIVYNVPQHPAIDFVQGRKYFFTGDTSLLADDFLRNFHIKPSRIVNRVEPVKKIDDLTLDRNIIRFAGKRILVLDENLSFTKNDAPLAVDLLILSKNPKVYFNTLAKSIRPGYVVFDGSNPAWKVNYWKKDCDSLRIPYHDVSEKGAFVMRLN